MLHQVTLWDIFVSTANLIFFAATRCSRAAVEDFLRKLRVCNPESYILWCYGMLGAEILPTLEKAVGNYKRKTGDKRVEFVKLPDTQEGEFGSRQHPGHRSHEKTAKILVEKLTLLFTP